MTVALAATLGLALITSIWCTWRCAQSAKDCSLLASEFSTARKRLREMEAETAELSASFENLLASHKRLRSRQGMQTLREKRGGTPAVETKAQLLARMGLAGKSGPEFARAQLQMVSNADDSD
jgi:hypothetical protein